MAAGDAVAKLAEFGFVHVRADALSQRIAGNTLRSVDSFSFYAKDRTVALKELELGGGLSALAIRAVYYELVALGVVEKRDGEDQFGVWSAGEFFSFGAAPGEAD